MAEKKGLSAKEVLVDIRSGFSDQDLMEKYGISTNGLQSLLEKLVAAGILKQSELEARAKSFEETVDIDEAVAPAQLKCLPTYEGKIQIALDKLKGLLDSGLLTETEFDLKKSELLERSAKAVRLKQAFDAGILTQDEYERKIAEAYSRDSAPKNQTSVAAESPVGYVLEKIARSSDRGAANRAKPTPSDDVSVVIYNSRLTLAGVALVIFASLLFFLLSDNLQPVGFLHFLPASVWEPMVSIILPCVLVGALFICVRALLTTKPVVIRTSPEGIYYDDEKRLIKWTDIDDIIYTVKQEEVWGIYGRMKSRSKVLRIVTSQIGNEAVIDMWTGALKRPPDGWESTALKLKAMKRKYAMT